MPSRSETELSLRLDSYILFPYTSHMEQVIGYIASGLLIIGYFPQAVKVWKTKQTRDISMGTFSILVLASVTWIVYGVLVSDGPIILTNIVTLFLQASIAYCKMKYGR